MTKRDYIRRKALVMGQTLDEILPTYEDDGRNPITSCLELPSEVEVVRALLLLESVFFPGYREQCPGRSYPSGMGYSVETVVTERLDEAYDIFYRQFLRAIPYRWKSEWAQQRGIHQNGVDPILEAESVVGRFFGRLTHVRDMLKK